MNTTLALGIDLGDKVSHACLVDDTGTPVLRDRVRTTPEAMRAFFAPLAAVTNKPAVVMESGTHSRWVSEIVKELGLEVAAVSYPETKRLTQVPGIGPIASLGFVLSIEDPQRFNEVRDVGAWLGLVPRRDQSGGRDPHLRITKAGNSFLRRLLVNCAQYNAGPFGPDSNLRRFAERLGPRGTPRRKKAPSPASCRCCC